MIANCSKCNNEFENTSKDGYIKKFCSRSCANSKIQTEEMNNARSKKLKGKSTGQKGKLKVERVNKICEVCECTFVDKISSIRKYCSTKCSRKRPNQGGYRKGSGHSRKGYYQGIYCGSTYELCWVIHSIDHNVKFQRFPGFLEKDGLKYYPDFLLEDGSTIIETKGFEKQEKVDKKTQLAESFGYNVIVLREKDLKSIFDYVSTKYGTKDYCTLYDSYKPKYQYVCEHCNSEIFAHKKRPEKVKKIFCSRTCAGKHRFVENRRNNADFKGPSKNGNHRSLTKEQALEIYYDTSRSLHELGSVFNLTSGSIWFIQKKKTYKWIHE